MTTRGEAIRRAKLAVSEHASEMRAQYEAGGYLREVAEKFGITEGTAARAIRKAGGTIRPRGFGSTPERFVGPNNPAWRGGSYLNSEGYRLRRVAPDHPYISMARRQYIPEHRLVMAELVKRPLLPTETVHHIDGDKLNNAPENLQLRMGRHGKGQHYRCRDCGSVNVRAYAI